MRTLLLIALVALSQSGCWWLLVGGGAAEGGYIAGQDDRKAGETVSDQLLHTRVKAALLGASGVPSTRINVDVHKGLVRLKGVVDNADQKSKAIAAARGVSGVKGVVDKLFISQ
jgi:hyperosmotically inducible periplasmic protein